jgi:MFS transporter, UMF1 family
MADPQRRGRAPGREIFGWAMFDFANSSYTTVIITVIYAVVFSELIVGEDRPGEFRTGNLLWSVALSVSYGLVVLTGPVFGAIMDYRAAKKKFLFASYLLTIIATGLLYLAGPGDYVLAMILVIASNFGFATGESFVSSFLPDLGPPEDYGKISGYAWGLGYFGGLVSVVLVTLLGPLEVGNFGSLRLIGPVTAAFFLVAAIPTFVWVKERGISRSLPAGQTHASIGFVRLRQTFREIRDFRDLMIFLIAVFFAMAGLSIVISFAFIYGNQVIRWDETSRTLMFVITQFTAAGGALLFGFIQDRVGARRTFNITLALWVLTVMLIWGTTDVTRTLNSAFGTAWEEQSVFLFIGCLAGVGLGSTQSASRAIVGLFCPESKAGEFFGFWGLSGKLASIVGILTLGLLQSAFGLHSAIVVCAAFFLVAFIINLFVNEQRGRIAALKHEGE